MFYCDCLIEANRYVESRVVGSVVQTREVYGIRAGNPVQPPQFTPCNVILSGACWVSVVVVSFNFFPQCHSTV